MKKPETKLARALPWLVSAIGLVLLVYGTYMLVIGIRDYSRSSDLYEDTNNEYVSIVPDKPVDDKQDDYLKVNETTDWKDLVDVDISGLKDVNKDVSGWIYFENIDISYPVLYSQDNSKYLRRTYTGESLTAGSIFIEGTNSNDFTDAHTIIYGHNMDDRSMFGKLEYFVTVNDYINDHEYFQIITENKKYRYKIISYKIVGDDSDVYTVYKAGGQNFVNFVNDDILSGNLMEYDYDIDSGDHIITLSTCYKDDRLVVSAVRCDESSY